MDFLAIKTGKEHVATDRQLSESASDVIVCQLFCLLFCLLFCWLAISFYVFFYVFGPAGRFRLLRSNAPRGYKMKRYRIAQGG
jgi:hypothetical protein